VTALLARTTLSQMDVPTRQALVMSVVTPGERTMAAAVTNATRCTVRPLGPLVAGAVQQIALGAPLLVAGTVKAGYDLALWRLGPVSGNQRPARDAPEHRCQQSGRPRHPVATPTLITRLAGRVGLGGS
jgi:hypothetical protein